MAEDQNFLKVKKVFFLILLFFFLILLFFFFNSKSFSQNYNFQKLAKLDGPWGSSFLNDNELIVTLPVSESLPWYAAYLAVANPIVGLGVIVGERVFRKPIEKFSSGKFKIKGNINDPEVSFLGLWDQKVEIENFMDFELDE